MAGVFAMTSYLQKAALDHVLNKATLAPPTELYLSLHTASPTDSGSYTNEVSGGAYARQGILSAMGSTTLSTSVAQNGTVIQSPVATAEWGTISHIGIGDSLSGGTMWLWAQLVTAKVVTVGERFQFVPGQLQITLGSDMTLYLRKALLDHILNKATLTSPTELYLSLHKADPTSSGSYANEVTGDVQYARQAILAKMGSTDLSTGIANNTTVIDTNAAAVAWGTITYAGFGDGLTGGTMWLSAALAAAEIINIGGEFQLKPNQLQFAFD